MSPKKPYSRSISLGLTIVSLILLPASLEAKGESAKKKDVRKLLVLTGSGKIGLQVMTGVLEQYKTALPHVPAAFWKDFMKEVRVDDLIDRIVPIYDKYFTHDEIKALMAFYQTKVGKKMVSVLPQITRDSMVVGEQWGRQLAEKVSAKLKKKGYDKK